MRFTLAWANVLSENVALKLALICVTLALIASSLLAVKFAHQTPLVIERSCLSKALPTQNNERTSTEIETFVREALPMRFDTLSQPKPDYLSEEEIKFRTQEQQELKKRDLSQRLVINSVTVTGDQISIDADRLFTLGTVRSVLPFPLLLTVRTVSRSEWNPYGLTLLKVTAPATGQSVGGGGK